MSRRAGALPQRRITEAEFQRQVIDLAVQYHWHVPGRDVVGNEEFELPGIAYHPQLSKWSERGWPDLTLVRVRGHQRRVLFAELKSATGQLSARQGQVLRLLRRLEGTYLLLEGPAPRHTLQMQVFLWRPDDLGQIAEVLA